MTKLKQKLIKICSISIFFLILLCIYAYELRPPVDYELSTVNAKKEVVKDLPIGEWIMKTFKENGLNEYVAYCVLYGESRMNPDAININSNGTLDAGIAQINSIHKDILMKDKFDYKKSILWTINKVKRDGNWNAWYGYRDNNCGIFGKTFIN